MADGNFSTGTGFPVLGNHIAKKTADILALLSQGGAHPRESIDQMRLIIATKGLEKNTDFQMFVTQIEATVKKLNKGEYSLKLSQLLYNLVTFIYTFDGEVEIDPTVELRRRTVTYVRERLSMMEAR